MKKTPAPAYFQQSAIAASVLRPDLLRRESAECQTLRGVTGPLMNSVKGRDGDAYSDPHGTVFIDTGSHAGAWAKFLRDKGECCE